MARHKSDSIAMDKILDRFVEWSSKAPTGRAGYPVSKLIRLLRQRLAMTQSQLARRASLTQSHIANIEAGNVDPQWSTLTKIFSALGCGLVAAPVSDGLLTGFLRIQARKAALRNVSRVAGTMAMEKQRPDDKTLDDLVEAETERLVRSRSSEIWEENEI